MEQLAEHCEWGMPNIALRKDFEEIDKAKQLLTSIGYVQHVDTDDDDSSILFEKEKFPNEPGQSPTSIVFPLDPPIAKYKAERGVYFSAFQVNDLKTQQVDILARIPKLNIDKHQRVGLALVVQPLVEHQDQQLHVKLRIERLTLGIVKKDFLTEEHHCIGCYPDFVGITIEPVDLNVVAVPTYIGGNLGTAPSMVNLTSTTTVGGQLGYGPISVKLEHARAKQRAVESSSDTKVKLVRIDDVGIGSNSASFEWSILRWANGKQYNSKDPHSGLRNVPKLPFGTCASLEGFPDIQWKFSRNSVKLKQLKFRIRLEVQMHLVWFVNGTFGRSFNSLSHSFKYENVWNLKE